MLLSVQNEIEKTSIMKKSIYLYGRLSVKFSDNSIDTTHLDANRRADG